MNRAEDVRNNTNKAVTPYLVRDFMSTDLHTVIMEDTLGNAYRLMKENDFRHLPVVDAHGVLVGIVTLTDLLSRVRIEPNESLGQKLALLDNMWVQNIMSSPPIVLYPDDSLKKAAKIFRQNKIGGAPVVDTDSHELIGMLTETDMFTAVMELLPD